MITVKGQTDIDKFIIGHIIDPSAANVEFKNITFDCKTIKDASGHIFVQQKAGEWQKEIKGNGWSEWAVLTCDQCGAVIENPTFETNYCPNCGAKMGGRE